MATKIRLSNITQPLDQDLSVPLLTAQSVNITDTTEASNTTSAALTVAGGIASQKDLIVGGGNAKVITGDSSSILTLERTGAGASQLDISLAAQKATFTSSQDGFRFIQGTNTLYEARFGVHTFNTNAGATTLTLANDGTATFSGDLTVSGDFLVSGNTTTLNVDTLAIEDLNITLASGAANNTVANGAGITIDGANAQITYTASSDQFEINKNTRIDNGIDITDYMFIRYGRINAEDDMQVYGDYYTKLGRVSDGAGGWKDAITIENSQNLTNDRITLDANVGIGESAPDTTLHIKKNQSSAASSIKLENSAGGNDSSFDIDWQLASSGTSARIRAIRTNNPGAGDTDLVFSTSDNGTSVADRLTIKHNGLVGIGTDTPNALLDLAGATASSSPVLRFTGTGNASAGDVIGQIEFYNSDETDNTAGIMGKIRAIAGPSGGEGSLQFLVDMPSEGADAATVALHLNANGNVGIGTDAPNSLLTLERNVTTSFSATGDTNAMRNLATMNLVNTTQSDDDSVGILFEARTSVGASGGIYYVSGGGTNNGRFAITARQQGSQNSAELVTIKNTGNIGLGTSDPSARVSILTPGATGGTDTLGLNIINNGNSFDINGLDAYNDTTGYDIVQKASYTYHARGQSSGNITTIASGSTGATHTARYVNLGSPQSDPTVGITADTYYQYSGSGNTNASMAVPENVRLHNIYAYNGGGVDIKFAYESNGDFYAAGSYESGKSRHSVRPSILLDFAKIKKLDSRISFFRDSTATYYDGKTKVKAEENLLTYSQQHGAWNASRCSVSNNAATAPDGTATASQLTQTAGQTSHSGVYQSVNLSAFRTYTHSVFAKKVDKDYIILMFGKSSGGVISASYTWFNINTGQVGTIGSSVASANIENYTNGWYRCSVTFNYSETLEFVYAYQADTDNSTTVVDSGSTYLWGSQLEQRSSTSAYTVTTDKKYSSRIPVMQTAQKNIARFDCDPVTNESKGLLIESERTNLEEKSVTFENFSKGNNSILLNSTIAPDGTMTASAFRETDGSTEYQRMSRNYNVSGTGVVYTYSVFAKKGLRRYLTIDAGPLVIYNLDTGEVTGATTSIESSSMIDVGNGWWRCTYTETSTSASAPCYIGTLADGNTNGLYSGVQYPAIYLWGMQAEIGKFATTHIPTSGYQKTRQEDHSYIFSLETSTDELTVYTEFGTNEPQTSSEVNRAVHLTTDRGDAGNITLGKRGSRWFELYNPGNTYYNAYDGNWSTYYTKMALSQSPDGITAASDGEAYTSFAAQGMPYIASDKMRVYIGGQQTAGNQVLNGHIKKIAIYPEALTSAELIALTEA